MEEVIQVINVYKSFGSQQVLKGVSLSVKKGELLYIIGKSGEGKSVLLKHMVGLIRPDKGKVLIEGQDLHELKGAEALALRKRVGMVFQYGALFDSMTVYENVAFPLREHTNLSEEEIAEVVKEKLTLVDLEGVEHKLPSELSGGMRKRVALARALALNPAILLYDEPTTGLDPLLTEEIDMLIKNTRDKTGVTSVVVSHDVWSVIKYADRVAYLAKGRIEFIGTPKEMLESDNPMLRRFICARLDENLMKSLFNACRTHGTCTHCQQEL